MKKLIQKYNSFPIQLKASLWFLLCSFLQKGIATITTPIFTRLMTSDEYGDFGVFNSWYSIISIIVSMNLASGVYTTAMVKFGDNKRVLASSYQGLTLLLCSVWIIIYFLFSSFWNGLFHLTTVQMLAMFTMIWASAAFSLWSIEQRVAYNYKQLVTITIFASIVQPIVGIILVVWAEDKVTARILGLAVVELVCYTGVAISQFIRGKVFFSKKYWLYALRFNLPLIPHALSQTILSSSDRIMIKDIVGESQAGYYNLAYNISSIMLIFNIALSQTLAPWTYQKLKADRAEDINGVAVFSIGVIGFMNLLLIVLAPEMVRIFAPPEYAEAAYVIPPVAMSVFFMYLYDWFARFEYYYEKTHYILIASLTGALLNLILNYICIHEFGYIAAGYTTLICYMVYSFMHYYFMNKICKQSLPGRKVYNMKMLFSITGVFLIVGFLLIVTYRSLYLRYCILALLMFVAIINYKFIIRKLKEIVLIRKPR